MSEHIGRYRVLECIGRGPWGMVFRAHDPNLNRFVAIQVVPTDGDITEEVHGRFWREASHWAGLDHPNVASVYDIGQDDSLLYVAYELVEGEALSAWSAESRVLPLAECLRLMIRVCEALEAAHERGILHGRVEPANIRIARDGCVKLVHFGMQATEREDAAGWQGPFGLMRYMAPEQFWGRRDHRVDIFAVGAVCYELLTFTAPVAHDDPAAQASALAFPIPIRLPIHDERVPPELAAVLERALEKDPNDRFRHISELRHELEAILAGDVLNGLMGEALAETVTEALRVVVPSRAGRPLALGGPADGRAARVWWARPRLLAAGILLMLGVGAGYTVMMPPNKHQATAERGSTPAVDRLRPGLPAFTMTAPPAPAADPATASVVAAPRAGRMAVRASPPRPARRSAAVRSAQPRHVVSVAIPNLPTHHAEAQSLPFASTLEKDASPGVPVVSGTEMSSIGGPARDGTQVSWKVTDMRTEVGDAGRLRWTYTVVIRQRTDAVIWLHNEERAAFGARFGTVETVARAARLDPRAELRLAMATEGGGLTLPAFPGADYQVVWIWHRFRGTAESGEPVTIDVQFPVYAFGARPTSEGGL